MIRPLDKLTVTVDAYQIRIRDRILGTGTLFGSGGATNFPIVTAAIAANGNILDPTVHQPALAASTGPRATRATSATTARSTGRCRAITTRPS